MTKLKKVGIWNFGIVFVLAFVVYRIVQIAASYALTPLSSYIQVLVAAENTLAITIIQWILVIILTFIAGIIFMLVYNLLAKWIGLKIEVSETKKK